MRDNLRVGIVFLYEMKKQSSLRLGCFFIWNNWKIDVNIDF
ncbi:hypothetical protein D922_03439 [Enterococcus faecalis 06-MB-DW-09]|nr:hypothetical protein D922_03439 [Enterococcus faecalis 06-MB-DW-09]